VCVLECEEIPLETLECEFFGSTEEKNTYKRKLKVI
jgi:hypothetical protein